MNQYLFAALFCLLTSSAGFGQVTQELDSDKVTESSGVCVSQSGDLIWTHNDSGDKPRIFAFHRTGRFAGIAKLAPSDAIDWEDICSFSVSGRNYLAIGDIGDNGHKRDAVEIYVIAEPTISDLDKKKPFKAKVVCRLEIKYPDGPVNCEALAYDPIRRVFVLPSKEFIRCRLFEVDARDLKHDRTVEAKLTQTFHIPLATGADISRDGQRFVFSTYGPGCMLYRDEQSRWQLSDPQIFEVPSRRQGESICFGAQGKRLLLTSEFAPTPLFSIPCPPRN